MKNCHDDMIGYHNDMVTLRDTDRNEMRDRRDANRKRLKEGLERDDEPALYDNKSQGSYAMRTMVQQPGKDYDVDDGVYFLKSDLVGPRGGNRSTAEVKEMVRKAVHSDSLKTAPTVRQNCVRVLYNEGYHVDLPVYRVLQETDLTGVTKEYYELAGSAWKQSDAQKVTKWFTSENRAKSPNTSNGGQLRRVTRLLKKYARSRDSWKERIATGFVISKLVIECYQPNEEREDRSLYDAMVSIRDRLEYNLEVEHPVLEEMLTSGPDDAKTRYLKEKLSEAIATLEVLFDSECTTKDARKAWDKVFNTDYFGNRPSDDDGKGSGGPRGSAAILIKRGDEAHEAVEKRGGGTYANETKY